MLWVILAVVLLVIAVIVYASYVQKSKWKTVLEERGMTEEASDKYSYLLNNGIRCRLRQIAVSNSGPQTGMAMQSEGIQKVRVEVHRDDYEKAKNLLDEYHSGHTYSPTSTV